MNADAKKYVEGMLTAIVGCLSDTRLGMDMALSTIYYIFFGADLGVDETTDGYRDLNALWRDALDELAKASPGAADFIKDILDFDVFDDLIDGE